ncbi:MAG: DUF368 domain-containing protein [Chloroflexia bacterium]|nr:DUF368 domain-containing protein [Chloroflexia bacterium]
MSRTIKDYIVVGLKGIAMGAADVVPGVSGGTIAFISGIYEELIESIKSINLKSLKVLFKKGFKSFWSSINGFFLLFLVLGIGISIFSLAKLFHYLLDEFPIFIWSFFFGLIVASAVYVAMQIKNWNYKIILGILVGTVIAFFITTITPVAESTNPSYIYIFLCGMIAICAMILPGISGSFILLLLGQYKFILSALSEMKGDYIAIFGVGAAIGLISFSNVLSWLLKKFHDITVAFLAGFMIGSLNKVWPWKHTLESYVNSNAEIIPISQENVFPNTFYELTAKDPQTFYAILLAITGFLVIFLLQSAFNKVKSEKPEITE